MANLIDVLVGAAKRALGSGESDVPAAAGFKALGSVWFAWWSNSFQDHDDEYFAEKAIDEYVRRVDVGAVPYPELWLWHTPGTKHGQAEWVGRIGHFAVAAGSFDDTPAGKAAQAHYAKAGGDYGMSHGFTYDPGQKSDGVFHQFNTFEISVLPAKAAANPYTQFSEVFEMEMDDEKFAFLARVLGSEEIAQQLVAATEDKSRAMEALDVRYKDFVRMDEPAVKAEDDEEDTPETEAVPDEDTPTEATPEEKADVGAFIEGITEDVAALANVVNSLIGKLEEAQTEGAAEKARRAGEVAELRAEVKALSEALDLRPRSASTDPATEIERSALTESLKAQIEQDDYETVLGLRVRKSY